MGRGYAWVAVQAGLQVEGPGGRAWPQHLPDLRRDGLAQERAVRRGERTRLARRLAVARLPVERRQQEAAILAEPRARQRLPHDGIAGQALIARQEIGRAHV